MNKVHSILFYSVLFYSILFYLSLTRPSWWRHQMEKFSALLAICAGNSPVSGEFPPQRPVTWSFDVCFDLGLSKRSSKQSWGWWFETLSRPFWRHCNGWLYLSHDIYSRSKTFRFHITNSNANAFAFEIQAANHGWCPDLAMQTHVSVYVICIWYRSSRKVCLVLFCPQLLITCIKKLCLSLLTYFNRLRPVSHGSHFASNVISSAITKNECLLHHQTSNIRRKKLKLKCFSSRLAVVFAQFIEARCLVEN